MKKEVKPVEDQRPFLSLLAQDGLPLKLILDSGQEFDVMSAGQSHHVIISYTLKKRRGRKLGSKNKYPKQPRRKKLPVSKVK